MGCHIIIIIIWVKILYVLENQTESCQLDLTLKNGIVFVTLMECDRICQEVSPEVPLLDAFSPSVASWRAASETCHGAPAGITAIVLNGSNQLQRRHCHHRKSQKVPETNMVPPWALIRYVWWSFWNAQWISFTHTYFIYCYHDNCISAITWFNVLLSAYRHNFVVVRRWLMFSTMDRGRV